MDQSVQNKSFQFAVRVTKLCRYLQNEQREFVLTKQLLRCGTSIGANVSEAQQAQSRADFVSKLNIALKEAYETNYWLRLLHATDILSPAEFGSIYADCQELERRLIAIVKTSKE